jgi:hypothetical protein
MVSEISNPSTSSSPRPWYRLRMLTTFALIAIGAALVYVDLSVRNISTSIDQRNNAFVLLEGFGWPFYYSHRLGMQYEKTDITKISTLPAPTAHLRWDLIPQSIDLGFALFVLASTAFVCERRYRRNVSPSQFNTRSMFSAAAVVCIVTALYTNSTPLPAQWEIYHRPPFQVDRCGLSRLPWYIVAPMLFGIACTVFTTGWLICWIAAQIIRRFSRRSATIRLGL